VALGEWVESDGANLWIVDTGLKAGDPVIVDGMARLQPGAPINLGGAPGGPGAPGAGAAPAAGGAVKDGAARDGAKPGGDGAKAAPAAKS
jgi:membrane fusion protein (multidrug efflux system)